MSKSAHRTSKMERFLLYAILWMTVLVPLASPYRRRPPPPHHVLMKQRLGVNRLPVRINTPPIPPPRTIIRRQNPFKAPHPPVFKPQFQKRRHHPLYNGRRVLHPQQQLQQRHQRPQAVRFINNNRKHDLEASAQSFRVQSLRNSQIPLTPIVGRIEYIPHRVTPSSPSPPPLGYRLRTTPRAIPIPTTRRQYQVTPKHSKPMGDLQGSPQMFPEFFQDEDESEDDFLSQSSGRLHGVNPHMNQGFSPPFSHNAPQHSLVSPASNGLDQEGKGFRPSQVDPFMYDNGVVEFNPQFETYDMPRMHHNHGREQGKGQHILQYRAPHVPDLPPPPVMMNDNGYIEEDPGKVNPFTYVDEYDQDLYGDKGYQYSTDSSRPGSYTPTRQPFSRVPSTVPTTRIPVRRPPEAKPIIYNQNDIRPIPIPSDRHPNTRGRVPRPREPNTDENESNSFDDERNYEEFPPRNTFVPSRPTSTSSQRTPPTSRLTTKSTTTPTPTVGKTRGADTTRSNIIASTPSFASSPANILNKYRRPAGTENTSKQQSSQETWNNKVSPVSSTSTTPTPKKRTTQRQRIFNEIVTLSEEEQKTHHFTNRHKSKNYGQTSSSEERSRPAATTFIKSHPTTVITKYPHKHTPTTIHTVLPTESSREFKYRRPQSQAPLQASSTPPTNPPPTVRHDHRQRRPKPTPHTIVDTRMPHDQAPLDKAKRIPSDTSRSVIFKPSFRPGFIKSQTTPPASSEESVFQPTKKQRRPRIHPEQHNVTPASGPSSSSTTNPRAPKRDNYLSSKPIRFPMIPSTQFVPSYEIPSYEVGTRGTSREQYVSFEPETSNRLESYAEGRGVKDAKSQLLDSVSSSEEAITRPVPRVIPTTRPIPVTSELPATTIQQDQGDRPEKPLVRGNRRRVQKPGSNASQVPRKIRPQQSTITTPTPSSSSTPFISSHPRTKPQKSSTTPSDETTLPTKKPSSKKTTKKTYHAKRMLMKDGGLYAGKPIPLHYVYGEPDSRDRSQTFWIEERPRSTNNFGVQEGEVESNESHQEIATVQTNSASGERGTYRNPRLIHPSRTKEYLGPTGSPLTSSEEQEVKRKRIIRSTTASPNTRAPVEGHPVEPSSQKKRLRSGQLNPDEVKKVRQSFSVEELNSVKSKDKDVEGFKKRSTIAPLLPSPSPLIIRGKQSFISQSPRPAVTPVVTEAGAISAGRKRFRSTPNKIEGVESAEVEVKGVLVLPRKQPQRWLQRKHESAETVIKPVSKYPPVHMTVRTTPSTSKAPSSEENKPKYRGLFKPPFERKRFIPQKAFSSIPKKGDGQASPNTVVDELPASIKLRPEDVIQNRKPARTIPPGSVSEKLKTMQEKVRLTTTTTSSPITDPQTSSSTTTVKPTEHVLLPVSTPGINEGEAKVLPVEQSPQAFAPRNKPVVLKQSKLFKPTTEKTDEDRTTLAQANNEVSNAETPLINETHKTPTTQRMQRPTTREEAEEQEGVTVTLLPSSPEITSSPKAVPTIPTSNSDKPLKAEHRTESDIDIALPSIRVERKVLPTQSIYTNNNKRTLSWVPSKSPNAETHTWERNKKAVTLAPTPLPTSKPKKFQPRIRSYKKNEEESQPKMKPHVKEPAKGISRSDISQIFKAVESSTDPDIKVETTILPIAY